MVLGWKTWTSVTSCTAAAWGTGLWPETYGVDYARSSRTSASGPAAGREVGRCGWKDMCLTLKEYFLCVKQKIVRRIVEIGRKYSVFLGWPAKPAIPKTGPLLQCSTVSDILTFCRRRSFPTLPRLHSSNTPLRRRPSLRSAPPLARFFFLPPGPVGQQQRHPAARGGATDASPNPCAARAVCFALGDPAWPKKN